MSGPSVPSIAAQAARPGRRGSLPSARLAAAAAGLVVSVTVVTWWVVGDRSPHVAATLSYDLGPYAMAPALERTLGLVALAGTLFCSATLIRAAARHRLDARWWAPLAVAVLAGIVRAARGCRGRCRHRRETLNRLGPAG
jgi:hypothetical protein